MATKKPPPSPLPGQVFGADRGGAAFDDLFLDTADDKDGRRVVRAADEVTDDLAAAAVAVRSTPGDVVPAPDARLDILLPNGVTQMRALQQLTSIGRHTDNVIQLLDPEVSKAHLVIRRVRDAWMLEDLNSANGTIVNGTRQARCRLNDGDVVNVGNSTLTFRVDARPRAGGGAARVPLNDPISARPVAPVAPAASSPTAQPGQLPPPAPHASSASSSAAGRPVIRPPAVVNPVRPGVALSGPSSSPPGRHAPQVLTSFAQVRRSDAFAERRVEVPRAEQTSVTLIPAGLASEAGGDSVFAEESAELDFVEARSVDDERALRRDYERLRVAFELFTNVGLETDLEALGELILKKIRGVLSCDTAVIMLRDPTMSDDLVALASWSEQGQAVHIPRAIIERVLTTKSGLLTSDAQVDKELRRSETIVGARIRSALCVPLVVRGDVVGAIHLSSTSLAGAYETKDLALLRAIAQPAALAVANARLRRKIEEEAAMRAELSRFLSPALVEKAVRNELNLGTAGDKVQCTILFSDIRGFTSISDGAAPEQVVSMLNEYFDAMVEVVFQYGGTLDKFLGDGLMAVWGTPVQAGDDPVRAVRAALDMRKALQDIVNAARVGRGESPLSVGYGIATGRVVAGAMGARRRQDFTVIGDTVNLSSRLCGQARAGQLLVDEQTDRIIRAAGLTTTALEPRQIKGFARPVPVFEVSAAPVTAPAFEGVANGKHLPATR
jgi:adenylate cyclase